MFDLVLAKIFEGMIHAITDLFINAAGYTDAAGFGKRFDTRRYINAFAVNVFAVIDDIAEVDAYAKFQFARRQVLLQQYGAVDSIENAYTDNTDKKDRLRIISICVNHLNLNNLCSINDKYL